MNSVFANEVALACESMGVDVFEARELMDARSDRHMHLPALEWGGTASRWIPGCWYTAWASMEECEG